MPDESLNSLLPVVIELAHVAGAGVMAIYNEDPEVEYKEDNSPLTRADRLSHDIISKGLNELELDYPILSEEGRVIAFDERRKWRRYWLIDPLDGTKEFIQRNGEFTVNIALIEQGRAVLGVVYAPALDVSYYAAAGYGAFKQFATDKAVSIHVRKHEEPQPWLVVASRSHPSVETDTFIRRLGMTEYISMGSSLKLCLVAEGKAHLYPRFAPTSEWDTAAAQCVVEQAGGKVVDRGLSPLTYNGKESLLNPSFIACYAIDQAWTVQLEAKDS